MLPSGCSAPPPRNSVLSGRPESAPHTALQSCRGARNIAAPAHRRPPERRLKFDPQRATERTGQVGSIPSAAVARSPLIGDILDGSAARRRQRPARSAGDDCKITRRRGMVIGDTVGRCAVSARHRGDHVRGDVLPARRRPRMHALNAAGCGWIECPGWQTPALSHELAAVRALRHPRCAPARAKSARCGRDCRVLAAARSPARRSLTDLLAYRELPLGAPSKWVARQRSSRLCCPLPLRDCGNLRHLAAHRAAGETTGASPVLQRAHERVACLPSRAPSRLRRVGA